MFKHPLLGSLAVLLLAGGLSAQTTVLSEDFNTWPPSGWTFVNNNGAPSQGWIQDSILGRAWHEDEPGGYTSDDTLMSPAMDLSALTNVYLHFNGQTGFAAWLAVNGTLGDGVSTVEVTTDGGLTWTVVWNDTSATDGSYAVDVDLSAYAGMTGVQLGIHYYGTFAQEWWVDDVLVNDNPLPPPPPPTNWVVNLPTSFVPAGMSEDFESYGGSVPGHMAITAEDALTGLPDPEAWCNMGQLGPSTGGSSGILAHSGQYCLEMGLDPNSTNYHQVRNALVIGLDGSAATSMMMDFWAVDHGEESDAIDGAWVSADGIGWYQVWGDWTPLLEQWQQVTGVDLASTPAATSGTFYLMFAQEDNFPMGYLDGVQVDDITVGGGNTSPTIAAANLVAGSTGQINCTNFTPGGMAYLAFSLVGGGPTSTPWGNAGVSVPYTTLPPLVVDASGNATFVGAVPPQASGVPIWFQGLDLGSATLSNALAETIQ